jgi:hypothetical protein
LPFAALLLEYNYYHQNNNDLDGPSTDMDTNTVLIGTLWEPTEKLSGSIKAGYTHTDFKEVKDFGGFATKTDLTYRYSDFTSFRFTAYRETRRATQAEREGKNYFISSGGSLSTFYSRLRPWTISLAFSYQNKDFENQRNEDKRQDDIFGASFEAGYSLTDELSLSLQYRYNKTNSTDSSVKYQENSLAVFCSYSL